MCFSTYGHAMKVFSAKVHLDYVLSICIFCYITVPP